MTDNCNCCDGLEGITPKQIANRPGLDTLAYRVGTHAAFLETMKARLSNYFLDISKDETDENGQPKVERKYPLRALTTRASNDPSIALLDAWATVGDVLTFYQERVANEGYLRTATERRSVLELARLVGYTLRPGVAATAYLAYTIDENQKISVKIPMGASSQSLPGPGELPQTFETSETLEARSEWNVLRPRLSRPQYLLPTTDTIYLNGIDTQLKPNDPLLIFDSLGNRLFRRVLRSTINPEAGYTEVVLTIRGEIDLELALLETSIQSNNIPEEEGPYSKSIGDELLSQIQVALEAWAKELKDEDKPLRELKQMGYEQLPRFEQAIRVLKALNFEQLVGWVETVVEHTNALLGKLEQRVDISEDEETTTPIIDLLRITELKKDDRAKPNSNEKKLPYSKELLTPELQLITMKDGEIDKILTIFDDPNMSGEEKNFAIRAEILYLGQLQYIFQELHFDRQAAWVSDLIQALNSSPSSGVAFAAFGLFDSHTSSTFNQNMLSVASGLFNISIIPSLPNLKKTPQVPLPTKVEVKRPVDVIYAKQSTMNTRFVSFLSSVSKETLLQAKKNVRVQPGPARVYALRITASLFGYNVPKQADYTVKPIVWKEWSQADDEKTDVVFLDKAYDDIMPGSFVVVQKAGDSEAQIYGGVEITIQPRSAYGLSAKTTRLKLPKDWREPITDIALLRSTSVYAQSEQLELAEERITKDLESGTKAIELNNLYDDLESGRSLIITGERTDIPDASGVPGSERVILVNTTEDFLKAKTDKGDEIDLPGDKLHTTIQLDTPLTYSYKRNTVKIYGNVVKATHGETRNEVLGSGDGSRSLQSFELKQPPLTFVPAPNPSGVDSTLHIYVNDVEWHEVDTLASLGPTDHNFITRTNEENKTSVIFGTGNRGARLPTGVSNVRARYRNGIGGVGNVQAGQISVSVSRPLGVKAVINPLGAVGGTDREKLAQARINTPLAVKSLDRLVSVQDYSDFACSFAGVGKANAVLLSNGRQQVVHVTVAGMDEDPISEASDLFQTLSRAFQILGDPGRPVQLATQENILLVLKANVQLHSDFLWEKVEPKIRARLLNNFNFEQRALGQYIFSSEVISVVQSVDGVNYVDIEMLDTVSTDEANDPDGKLSEKMEKLSSGENGTRTKIAANLATFNGGSISPAQLVFITSKIPETLILEELHQ